MFSIDRYATGLRFYKVYCFVNWYRQVFSIFELYVAFPNDMEGFSTITLMIIYYGPLNHSRNIIMDRLLTAPSDFYLSIQITWIESSGILCIKHAAGAFINSWSSINTIRWLQQRHYQKYSICRKLKLETWDSHRLKLMDTEQWIRYLIYKKWTIA